MFFFSVTSLHPGKAVQGQLKRLQAIDEEVKKFDLAAKDSTALAEEAKEKLVQLLTDNGRVTVEEFLRYFDCCMAGKFANDKLHTKFLMGQNISLEVVHAVRDTPWEKIPKVYVLQFLLYCHAVCSCIYGVPNTISSFTALRNQVLLSANARHCNVCIATNCLRNMRHGNTTW